MSDFNIVAALEVVSPELREYIVRQDLMINQLKQALSDTTSDLRSRHGMMCSDREAFAKEREQFNERITSLRAGRIELKRANRELRARNRRLMTELAVQYGKQLGAPAKVVDL